MSGAARPYRLQPRRGLFLQNGLQRRFLNHFISKAPPSDADPSRTPGRFRLAVKDNIATRDLPTTCASAILDNYHSPFDATVVSQLRARGAEVVGKTNLDEFGMGSHSTHSAFGPVRFRRRDDSADAGNSATIDLSAGGSSGGSAVAVVGRREADLALGTDTGGSVRLPAAYTGVVGFKPSYGMISRHGVVPYANSLDTVGFLAPDVLTISNVVAGPGGLYAEHDPRDPTSLSESARRRCTAAREGYSVVGDGEAESPARSNGAGASSWPLAGLTFGLPLEYNIEELDGAIRDAWAASAQRLQDAGARIVPVALPSTRHALSAYYVIAPAEASSNLAKYDGVRYGRRDPSRSDAAADGILYAATRGRGFGDEVCRRILLGSYTLSSEAMDNYFLQAQRVRRLVRRDFDRVFALSNPLLDGGQGDSAVLDESTTPFDLSDLPEGVPLEDKRGPAQVDFLLTPTAPTLPPHLDDVLAPAAASPVDAYVNDVFTVPASLAGLPAISIPVPVKVPSASAVAGLQLVGQYWDDARLLAVAESISRLIAE
ncbi:hypothetical protein VTK73DRAFT_8110 [Phialemonium thermophilum]|uniref:Glutamyl-tRNA(Gln) amidotransferase subunit A, mitochondrial n=1 Tax=Phialemonium thermophilum TaxID=223376 RepID=A0ABR3WA54_9PEZI